MISYLSEILLLTKKVSIIPAIYDEVFFSVFRCKTSLSDVKPRNRFRQCWIGNVYGTALIEFDHSSCLAD